MVPLEDGTCTVGYNVPPFKSPFTHPGIATSAYQIPDDCVVISNKAFSVNYADVTIR